MTEVVLLVFEGEKTELRILKSLEKCFFEKSRKIVIRVSYKADIYQLWRTIAQDNDLDLIEEIRCRNDENKNALKGISRKNVSEIFLFFDYDGHATGASDESIAKMLTFFNNEHDHGKLYISYPMAEAIRHINYSVDFSKTTFEILSGTKYKSLVNSSISNDFLHIKRFNRSTWDYIILENCKKANLLVLGTFRKPAYRKLLEYLQQDRIFDGQRKHHIKPNGQVAVLSAFPFFIIEYLGENAYNQL